MTALKYALLAGLAVIVLAAGVLAASLPLTLDLRQFAEQRLSHKFGRPVTIGSLMVTLADPIHIEMSYFHLANAPWGSQPDMFHADHLAADIDAKPLLTGAIRLRKMELNGAQLVLERDPAPDANGRGNWKFAPPAAPPAPHNNGRASLPTMLDLVLRDSIVTFRTSGGNILKINLNDVMLHTEGDDQPVTMTVTGAYQNVPVELAVKMDSFDTLHDVSRPFNADILAKARDIDIKLTAAMMDPLNFAGVQGPIAIDLKRVDAVNGLMGVDYRVDLPLNLTGQLTRNTDDWRMAGAEGRLAASGFKGKLALHEGARLQPDTVKLNLDFGDVDAKAIAIKLGPEKPALHQPDAPVFEVEKEPSILLDAKLGMRKLSYDKFGGEDVAFDARIAPGEVALEHLAARLLGGRLEGSVIATASGNNSHLNAEAAASELDTAEILRLLGSKHIFLTGILNGRVHMMTTGRSMTDLKRAMHGAIVITMNNGQASKRAIQLASADITGFMDKDSGTTPATCLLTVMNMQSGVGLIVPFRIMTADGDLFGGGQLDLPANTLDFTFKTERHSTGFFALDLPIHIRGAIDQPHVVPAVDSAIKNLKMQATESLSQLPPEMKSLAASNACAEPAPPP